jgi:hypothetical protein
VSTPVDEPTQAADDMLVVRMLDMPLLVRERSRQHGADLLREMALIQLGQASGTTDRQVPARLQELARELDTAYGPYIASSTDQMEDALDRGEESLDEVVYRLPRSAAAFVQRIADLLAEVETYCESDAHLLTLAPPPDVAAYRQWSIEEVLRQHDGAAPRPWPTFAAAQGLT